MVAYIVQWSARTLTPMHVQTPSRLFPVPPGRHIGYGFAIGQEVNASRLMCIGKFNGRIYINERRL